MGCMMKKKILKLFIFLTIISINVTTLCDDYIEDQTEETDLVSYNNSTSIDNINEPLINSRSAVVIDRNTNFILYGKDENEKRKMASTTKIMTALIIIENYNLKDITKVSKKAASTGGSRVGLKTGDEISVKDLLYGLMLCSGNDAAVTLVEYASGSIENFSELMNKKAKELNLNNTHFETPHGLDSDEHYTTAYELALLSNYALNNKTFSKIVCTKNYTIKINNNIKELKNTNELLGRIEGVYGVKTGFTNGANRCLVSSCKRNDIDIICVVLGADTKKFRTTDSISLINYIYNNFQTININTIITDTFNQWLEKNKDSFTINKGVSQRPIISLEKKTFNKIIIRKDFIGKCIPILTCQTSLNAPLYQNQILGNIHIKISDTTSIDYNINLSEHIYKKGFKNYFFEIIKSYKENLEYII